jgi:hypothetical protein
VLEGGHSRPIGMRNSPLFGMGDEGVPQFLTLDVGRIGDGKSTTFGDDLLGSIWPFHPGEPTILIGVWIW